MGENLRFGLGVLIPFLLSAQFIFGQGENSQRPVLNTAWLEIVGSVGLSLNFERIFREKNKHKLLFRIGGMALPDKIGEEPLRTKTAWSYAAPIELGLLLGESTVGKYLQLSVGYAFARNSYLGGGGSWSTVNGVVTNVVDNLFFFSKFEHGAWFRIGYRSQKPSGGFTFKVGITPIVFTESKRNTPNIIKDESSKLIIFPTPDVSFGWSF